MSLWRPSDEIDPYPGRGAGRLTFARGLPVLLHLAAPSEKFWGLLGEVDAAGVTLRGISVEAFDDWTREVARAEAEAEAAAARGDEAAAAPVGALGLATMFFPLHRVERLFLDEPIGHVESYAERFERRVGRGVGSLRPERERP